MRNLKFIMDESILRAENNQSKIPGHIAQLRGFSTPKIRHLLNNLCSFAPMNYLEIGSWSGSTFIPACYENKVNAVSIDNYTQFGPEQCDGFDAQAEFQKNARQYLKSFSIWAQWNEDFMKIDPMLGGKPHVFFYDGPHDAEATQKGIEIFGKSANQPFILLVDDIELVPSVWEGTKAALNSFTIHQSKELKKADGYHEGILVAIVERI